MGASAGRGVGRRVACPRPLPWRYPTGFAGVCFATVTGLVVWWLVRGLLVDVLWPWWVSMGWAFRVFDDVGASAGRGLGRLAGRCRCRWCGTSACSSLFEGVGGCVDCRLGRLGGRWLTTFVVFEGVGRGAGRRRGRRGRRGCLLVDDFCGSGVWSRLLAVVEVVWVVEVVCWLTTFAVAVWAFRVFEIVGGGFGRRLGRLVACVWSPPVTVRRASVM